MLSAKPAQQMTTRRIVAISVLLGFATGLLVLGVGGRIVMRTLTATLEAAPKFSILGTLEVIAAGAGWGAATGPLLLLFGRMRAHHPRAVGPVFGALVLALASLVVGLVAGFEGGIVAPTAFIVLSAILFPMLFLLHGIVVEALLTRRVSM